MATWWVAVIPDASGGPAVYGLFWVEDDARRFAAWLGREVNPAVVCPVRSAVAELLNRDDVERDHDMRLTEYWPPKHGDIWKDRQARHWCCQSDGTLSCLAATLNDTPSEIFRCHGPLTLVRRLDPSEVECPF